MDKLGIACELARTAYDKARRARDYRAVHRTAADLIAAWAAYDKSKRQNKGGL